MEQLLLDNLARNQAFDSLLRSGNEIDRLAGRYLQPILFQRDPGKRDEALGKLQREIVSYYEQSVQPQARIIGKRNAAEVLKALSPGTPADLNDPALRRKILFDGNLRPADRVAIVRAIVNDKANTLDNRLTAYWLEPGQNAAQKLERLKQIHQQQAQSLKDYEAKVAEYDRGGRETRPARPKLDYMAKLQGDVKQGVREQARRAGTDAETAAFAAQGFTQLMWVTVNASEACPDCRARQGKVGDLAYWDQEGRPGAGRTVCGAACYCMLVPARGVEQNPKLKGGLEVPTKLKPIVSPPPIPQPPLAPVELDFGLHLPKVPAPRLGAAPEVELDLPIPRQEPTPSRAPATARHLDLPSTPDTGVFDEQRQAYHGLRPAAELDSSGLFGEVKNLNLYARVPHEKIEQVLKEGRLKSQFETGSSKGALDPRFRSETELGVMGVPEDIRPEKRPVYGYLNARDGAELAAKGYGVGDKTGPYGQVVVQWKDDVKNRTTYTDNDSLGLHGLPDDQRIVAHPVTAPSSMAFSPENVAQIVKAGGVLASGVLDKVVYMEAQIHGGAPLADVAAIYFPSTHPPTQEMIRLMKKSGVNYNVVEHTDKSEELPPGDWL